MIKGPISTNIKALLAIFAVCIAIATIWYSQSIVEQLQNREKQIVTLYAKGIEYVASSRSPEADYTFIFENLIQQIDFPLILTDSEDNFDVESNTDIKNIEIDSSLSKEEKRQYLKQKLIEMANIHQPINIVFQDTIVLSKIYYGDSFLVEQLKIYPYVQFLIAAIFILTGYIAFSYIKRSEQSSIWVGLSKETAHQLGTPLSSLMGWIEILKINHKNPDKVLDTVDEMENDVERLKKITERFSKIGSIPELRNENINSIINRVINYFERRLPHTGKEIVFVFETEKQFYARLNPELFEWVIENLTKNALDAIEGKKGKIIFEISDKKNEIYIDVIDTGKGIDSKFKKDVFRPGFSTKKRGWGLGLSLSRRIIEEYHKGKIFIKSSNIDEGTDFRIVLKKTPNS